MGIRDTYPILARKTQLGGPAPRKYTINADEFDTVVDVIDGLLDAVSGGGGGGGFGYVGLTASDTLADENLVVQCDLTAGAAATLTLPAPSAGRLYIIRKIGGDDTKTITLTPHTGSVMIDGLASSRLLERSDDLVESPGRPYRAWLVYASASAWSTVALGAEGAMTWSRSAAPDDAVDTVGEGWYPGAAWHDGSVGVPGSLYLQCGIDANDANWHRVDGVNVLSTSVDATLPSKDRFVFVDTSSANRTLTLPPPGGANKGRQFAITKTSTADTHKITLARNGSEKINGTSANLDLPGSSLAGLGRWHAVSDGTDWWVF